MHKLTAIFEEDLTPDVAKLRLESWIKEVKASEVRWFDAFITTMCKHLSDIVNYFIGRLNSGFVEGFNNKIKLIKRIAYGLHDVSSIFRRVYLNTVGGSLSI